MTQQTVLFYTVALGLMLGGIFTTPFWYAMPLIISGLMVTVMSTLDLRMRTVAHYKILKAEHNAKMQPVYRLMATN